MSEKKVVNLSRFLMFEEAGDSEVAGFDGNLALDYDQANADEAHDDDDDDAQSCSSYVGCYGPLQSRDAQIEISNSEEQEEVYNQTRYDEDEDGVDYGKNGYHHHHKMRAFEEDEFEEEEEEVMSEVTSTANSYNSRKCVQSSNNNTLSEMEKSRLFWEACLAS